MHGCWFDLCATVSSTCLILTWLLTLIFSSLQAYTTKAMLEYHVRSQHEGRTYQCHHCPKVFTGRSGLTQHLAVHDNLKQWCCTVCGKSFNLQSVSRALFWYDTDLKKKSPPQKKNKKRKIKIFFFFLISKNLFSEKKRYIKSVLSILLLVWHRLRAF